MQDPMQDAEVAAVLLHVILVVARIQIVILEILLVAVTRGKLVLYEVRSIRIVNRGGKLITYLAHLFYDYVDRSLQHVVLPNASKSILKFMDDIIHQSPNNHGLKLILNE